MSNKITFAAGLSNHKKISDFPVFYILLAGVELYQLTEGSCLPDTNAQKIACPSYPYYCIITCFNENLKISLLEVLKWQKSATFATLFF